MGIKCDLDKFYTKESVALDLLACLPLTDYDLVIEPSAGAGSFSNNIRHPHVLALDLEPESANITRQDWFTYTVPSKYKKVILVGNPPFGKRNDLSKKFITHALAQDNIYTIAFVLPDVFHKHTNQSIFPKNWKLSSIVEMPRDSFMFEGAPYHVPCSFFVWTKLPVVQDLRFDIDAYKSTPDFTITLDKTKADFFVMGASPKVVKSKEDVHVNNRGYYIVSHIDKETLKNKFKQIEWSKFGRSSANGGVSWYTKAELIKVYEEQKNKI